MTAYDRTSIIGDEGLARVLRLFKDRAHEGNVVTTFKGRLSVELQRSAGDLLFNPRTDPHRVVGVEVKTEQRYSENAFLEYWSNRKRLTPGWLVTLRSDVLCYYFRDVQRVYLVNLPKLQEWAFRWPTGRRHFDGGIYLYPLKEQKTYDQPNDTWGRCVPWVVINRHVGVVEWTTADDTTLGGQMDDAREVGGEVRT